MVPCANLPRLERAPTLSTLCIGLPPARAARADQARHAGQPTDTHNGRRKGTGPTEPKPRRGREATQSAARRPRAPPPGGAEPGNRRARGGPARHRGPPERGSTRGRKAGEPPGRAERRRATEQGARRNADRPGGPASGGAARPRRSGRAAPSPGPQAARAPPRATQGSRGAVRKKRRGPAPQARERGTSDPRSRPAHRGGCGHTRRALRRGGPRGPQTRATRTRDLARARAPGKARFVRLSGALSAQRADNVLPGAYERSEFA